MNSFETSATVEEQGRVLVAGVPFAAGTEVEVTITPKERAPEQVANPEDAALAVARDRMRELFRTAKGFRMSPRISREELYERGSLSGSFETKSQTSLFEGFSSLDCANSRSCNRV